MLGNKKDLAQMTHVGSGFAEALPPIRFPSCYVMMVCEIALDAQCEIARLPSAGNRAKRCLVHNRPRAQEYGNAKRLRWPGFDTRV